MNDNFDMPILGLASRSTTDAKTTATLKEITRILSIDEGKITKEQNQEIFELFFSIEKVKSGMNSFFRTGNKELDYVFIDWVNERGLIDIIDINHAKVNWGFAVVTARIPPEHYNVIGPEKALRVAGETCGKRMIDGHPSRTIHFVYGDSREYKGPCSTGRQYSNICFFFVYKEMVGRYS